MKILLIQPCLSVSDRYGTSLGRVGPVCEPMGLAYLAAVVREKRKEDIIKILDMAALNYSQEDLINYLNDFKPDLVGISMLTPMYLRTKETMKIVRKTLNEQVKIVIGGPHPTVFFTSCLKDCPDANFLLYGEAEISFVNLLNYLENNLDLSEIKGLVFRKDERIIINPKQEFIQNLDEIPYPARDLLPMEKYRPAPTYFKKLPSYLILASRGCPFRCAFCSKISGTKYRAHSIERVINEIKILLDEYGAKDIIFRDDTFTINRSFVFDLCKKIKEDGLNKRMEWSCMTRVNLVDLELLKTMKEAGCWSIHYGVESGNQRLLDLIDKSITIEQIKNAFIWTKEVGIEIKAFFMLGLPTETREESLKTIEFSKELNPDWVQFTITVPYPGTKLFELSKSDPSLISYKWEDYQTWAGWSNKDLVYVPEGRTQEDLKYLQKYAMRSFYFRRKFIFNQLKNLNSFDRFKVYLVGGWALFKSKFS